MNDLKRYLDDPRAVRAAVVGDIIVDRYVEGVVERINPEAPVPVVLARSERFSLGGAANVARNLRVLGCDVTLFGVVGDDASGAMLREMCAAEGIGCETVLTDPSRPTTRKTRVISRGQHLVRIDWEEAGPVGPSVEERALSSYRANAPFDVVVLSDYAKGMLTSGILRGVIGDCSAAGTPALVDPKGRDFERYRGAFLVTPNRSEAENWFGGKLTSSRDVEEILTAMRERLELKAAVATLGPDGLAWVDEKGRFGATAAQAREVFDVTGAGDTAIATAACFIGAGAPLEAALRIANVAAGISVGKVGAVAVSRREIAERLASPGMAGKFMERSEAAIWAAAQRRAGRKVVFTNGCFDVLHRGHVEYLAFCRSQGDSLVVGLNSDRSVRALKGEGRPVNRQEDRAAVLCGLSAVDAVAVFDEDTPAKIVEEIDPAVLVKGEDWRDKGVVGREHVESRGGKVVLAPLLDGYSSSAVIGKMKKGT